MVVLTLSREPGNRQYDENHPLNKQKTGLRPVWFGLFVGILVRFVIPLIELIFDFVTVEMHPEQ